ncbi:glycoside hydrolase family 76 protein [uncultured Muribaculum sp.]|uniref:glycoside hydrolase family 76 protein n=1 Tax=uncultured Muribaculum sp. TaxID=1918613 RepID=UPI0025F53BA1|nr:glycoside hydrolase family 76 protein [uncultured Muribaculum sp.]
MDRKTCAFIVTAMLLPAVARADVKTTFQTSREWRPTIDNRADAVMVYGVGGNPSDKHRKGHTFEDRVKSWRDRGYTVHFMTGIAWGEYQDYFTGEYDGKRHLDEGQVTQQGDTIWHGHMVPYIVPTANFLKYLKERHIKRVIDNGIDAIFMEEPEFWARSGYSDAFKKEWKEYYGTDWRPQHESPEATYMSSKLKYHLYYRALKEIFDYAKEYGRSKGMDVKCYVPTHSLVNYSQWQIVSPEASLASMPSCDGYIAQVWTGTSREPNYYDGRRRERVFENAYLEYGSMEAMTAPTGRKVFFLTDPIEDWPRDWEDYRQNYQATFTAQLLYPGIADYEVMPWPERIYEGLYKKSANSTEKARIPRFYSTQMQVMVNSLNKMPLSGNKVSGTPGIGVLMGNSLMFQRFPIHEGYDDPQLSNFYGMALPFVKKGVPVQTVHIENLGYGPALADIKVLMMSYSNMKPLDKDAHSFLARWVKDGGQLVYSATDADPFQGVGEWWNSNGMSYATPSEHLFESMGLERRPAEGNYKVGRGSVTVLRHDPKEYILNEGGDKKLFDEVCRLYEREAHAGRVETKNNFRLDRGLYEVIAVVDESVSDEPVRVTGPVIDLYDPELTVHTVYTVAPGHHALLVHPGRIIDRTKPQVLASASREYDEKSTPGHFSYVAKGPVETSAVARVYLPVRPESVKIDGKETFDPGEWDESSSTYRTRFENSPEGVAVEFAWNPVAPLPSAYAMDDVWEAYDGFNNVFLDTDKMIYRNTSADPHATDRFHGAAAIWCQPMYADMALNAAALARKSGDKARADRYDKLARDILDGNVKHYLDFDFDNGDETLGWFIYDDIQWWTITMARAYLQTGDERYRRLAEQSFARVWYGSPKVGDTGSYADPSKGLGGGMYWQWQPLRNPKAPRPSDAKMSCINFPTVIAAMLLSESEPADRKADRKPLKWKNGYGKFKRPAWETKQRYLDMAKEIYDWSVDSLVDTTTGRVVDHFAGHERRGGSLIYNQGTFIGASVLLYLATGEQCYLDNAIKGAEYSVGEMSKEHGMLPWAHDRRNPMDQGGLEQGIYPAIWAQYMKLLVDECGQEQFRPFIEKNIVNGWARRDPSRGICDGESWNQTPEGAVIGSYSASSIPALMLLFPPK